MIKLPIYTFKYASGTFTTEIYSDIELFITNKWSVQRFQIRVEPDGAVLLTDKLGEIFAQVGELYKE